MKKHLPTTFEELAGLRARALVRVSTERQADGTSPEVQRETASAFADRAGLTLDGTMYEDHKSGSKAAVRTDFQRMVRDAEAGRFDVLLVYQTSRFGRNRREVAAYELRLHEAGVCIVYDTASFRGVLTTDPHVQHMLASNSTTDESWLNDHKERLFGAYRKRFEKAMWSGMAPLGYRMGYTDVWNPVKQTTEPVLTGVLTPDYIPRQREDGTTYTLADVAVHIGTVYAKGKTGARPLAALLNAEGYRTGSGGKFSGGSIRHIIENPAYNGWTTRHQRVDKRRHGEEPSEPVKTHEALWSDALWSQVQRVRRGAFRGASGGTVVNTYPFRRLVFCDRCGRKMYGESHGHKGQRADLYYGCIVAREQKACDQRAIPNRLMEEQVGGWLAGVSARAFTAWGTVEAALSAGVTPEPRKADTDRIERQLANLKELFLLGDLPREEYIRRSRALKAQLDDEMPVRATSAMVLTRGAAKLDDLGRLWLAANVEERADIARALFEEVHVRDRAIVRVKLADDTLLPVLAKYYVDMSTGAPPDGPPGAPVFTIDGIASLVETLRAA